MIANSLIPQRSTSSAQITLTTGAGEDVYIYGCCHGEAISEYIFPSTSTSVNVDINSIIMVKFQDGELKGDITLPDEAEELYSDTQSSGRWRTYIHIIRAHGDMTLGY